MSTAFVLSGGGSLGAVQVGMLQALGERGIAPDLLVGTSAGAVNAAWVAGHGMSAGSLAELARLWIGLRRQDVFPVNAGHALLAMLGRRSALSSNGNLHDVVSAHVGIGDLVEATVPLHLVATDLLSGEEVLLCAGDLVPAVLASAAIPGVFPPVTIAGRPLVDGGVADHTAVSQAVGLGATEIYVLPAGYPCALRRAPASALGVAVQALTLLIEQRLIVEVARYAGAATIKVLPPLCPLRVSAADFGHGADLVDRGRRATAARLDEGGVDLPHQERFLSLHQHRPSGEADRRLGSGPVRG
jgi:NTE family protein